MSTALNLINKKFGKLTVIGLVGKNKGGNLVWRCKCDCGTITEVPGGHLNKKRRPTQSCGCLRKEFMTVLNWGGRLRPYEALYHLFVRAAKTTPHSVHLSYEEFAEFAKESQCHYCGSAVYFKEFSPKTARYNLDRKNNTEGYSKENCVVCCKACNYAKGDRYTYEEWKTMIKALLKFRQEEVPIAKS
jgi:hypothetical protein